MKLGPWDFLPGCLEFPGCLVCLVCQVSLEFPEFPEFPVFPVFPESPECRGFHLGLRQRIAQ